MKVNFFTVIIWAFIIAIVVFSVHVFVKYGNKPITEIPSWAVPFFFGRK